MAWSLIPVCLRSSKASSGKKTSAKSKYVVGIEVRVSFATNAAICALQEGWTSHFWLEFSRKATWTTKVTCSGSRAAAAKSFFPTSSNYLVVRSASLMVYDLHQSSFFGKLIFVPFRVRKGIPKTTSGLMFATKKISSKNLTLSTWSVTEKSATIIP